MPNSPSYPTTPDGRYFVVRGRLWRATNPALNKADQQFWVDQLMRARRNVSAATSVGDQLAENAARAAVDAAKRALGERGPVWWTDGTPDLNRKLVVNTPYKAWYQQSQRVLSSIKPERLQMTDAYQDR